ncbi:MAG: hypothetical protein GWN01_09290 [Nitrosopumilaceae archaeon]|nr:hypothetical protein [Nitrosopumilaceae archaeon]NIU87803.1 hypothetical protein [Nitrosopumilaceae archaeon]NIV65185.1 hypothetical protein [Nitrosopumilaceae archaeon]NIX61701.1 hypothetical protein [Nitrosopumilaceae archaeon]
MNKDWYENIGTNDVLSIEGLGKLYPVRIYKPNTKGILQLERIIDHPKESDHHTIFELNTQVSKPRLCIVCKRVISTPTINQKYCSSTCAKQTNWRLGSWVYKPEPCVVCYKIFTPKRLGSVTCSLECRHKLPGLRDNGVWNSDRYKKIKEQRKTTRQWQRSNEKITEDKK